MKTLLQILFGIVLSVVVAVGATYSRIPFFWETHYPDGSYPITWRSGLLFLVIVAITQWIASLFFRRNGRPTSTGGSA
jgi:CDP-diglyceride synthetase